jgi:hypothetical protein
MRAVKLRAIRCKTHCTTTAKTTLTKRRHHRRMPPLIGPERTLRLWVLEAVLRKFFRDDLRDIFFLRITFLLYNIAALCDYTHVETNGVKNMATVDNTKTIVNLNLPLVKTHLEVSLAQITRARDTAFRKHGPMSPITEGYENERNLLQEVINQLKSA